MTLERDDIEAVAKRVVQLIEAQPPPASAADEARSLVDAATMARLLGVSRATVYARAEELGAIRVGNGKRSRLRFDPSLVIKGQGKGDARPARDRRTRRRKSSQGAKDDLLPIRGRRTPPRGPLVS